MVKLGLGQTYTDNGEEYFSSCQSGKRFGRGAITCKLVAEMLVNAGLTDILTMDLHHKEIQGGNSMALKFRTIYGTYKYKLSFYSHKNYSVTDFRAHSRNKRKPIELSRRDFSTGPLTTCKPTPSWSDTSKRV